MRLRTWLAAALILSGARAGAEDASPGLVKCYTAVNEIANFYRTLSPEETAEFNRLYAAYEKNVRRRSEQDEWTHGWTGNFWRSYVNDTNANGWLGGLFASAPTWTQSRRDLDRETMRVMQEEVPAARAALARAPQDARQRDNLKRAEAKLAGLQEMQSQKYGACSDWALDTFDVLNDEKPALFELKKETLVLTGALGDSGRHMLVEACTVLAPRRCVAFDPWKRGLPELVMPDNVRINGPGKANSCFKPAS